MKLKRTYPMTMDEAKRDERKKRDKILFNIMCGWTIFYTVGALAVCLLLRLGVL